MTHTFRCPRLGSEVFLSSLQSGFFIPLGFDIALPPAISRKLSIGLLTPVSTLGGLIVPRLRSVHDVQRLGLSIVPLFRRVQVIGAPMVRGKRSTCEEARHKPLASFQNISGLLDQRDALSFTRGTGKLTECMSAFPLVRTGGQNLWLYESTIWNCMRSTRTRI
jgi:hypothetical protein